MPGERDILAEAETVLVVDWPTKDVPESLARAGFEVFVHGGPGDEDYSQYTVDGDEVVSRRVGRPPSQADLVYSFRPLAELPEILVQASELGAKAVWIQSGVNASGDRDPKGCWLSTAAEKEARDLVVGAGLAFVCQPYIGETLRELGRGPE